jgi:heme-degrading monooxygenase HmoA
MRERLEAAKQRAGFIGGQILMPMQGLHKRVVVGTWETRAAWEAWHADPAFAETRKRLEGLEAHKNEQWWHEVLLDVRP